MTTHRAIGRSGPPPPASVAPADRSEPAVDGAVFTELWESLDRQPEPLRNIATSFKKTVGACLAALDEQDTGNPRHHLHTVIGTAGMIGATQVRTLAIELQDAFKAGNNRRLDELKPQLAAASERFERAFLARLDAEE